MQIFTRVLLFLILPFFANAQSTYLNQGSKDIHFAERLEIKQQRNNDLNFSAIRPFNRKDIVTQAQFIDSLDRGYGNMNAGYKTAGIPDLTPTDKYNLQSLLMNNSEWATTSRTNFLSKRPVLKTFYKTKANLLEVNSKDFFLAINPVLGLQAGKENNNNEMLFINTRGAVIRGMIAHKIGFSTSLSDNQERGPEFFRQHIDSTGAVPGYGFYKPFKKTGYDYFDARGYITVGVTKYINVQLGYDKNFIGNGYRSLFLSDWGNSYLFLKLNTRIWKLNYQNIYMELMPQFKKRGDTLLDRKYAVMHHLSMNLTQWLNIGLFESVIFSRKNHFDFEYLNPIIFYRSVEGNVGSPDNAFVGLDFKANIAHRFQLYGQFLLDEFVLSRIKNDPTYWANKWGIQLGAKYVDAFGINNLDLQVETNRVRPFTYSHGDTIANYTHYNQPLAHPLGANFQEFIGIANYQPKPKWYSYAKVIYYYQGLDSAGINFGADPFKNYRNRTMEFGFKIGAGNKATCLNSLLRLSYEIKQNLFFDAAVQYHTYKVPHTTTQKTTLLSAGLRLNLFAREYDY
jgi:hypothetical protein